MAARRGGLLLLLLAWLPAAGAWTLEYLGAQALPRGHGFADTTVGGLSGLDYDARRDEFLALSDDRGGRQPPRY